MTLLETEIADVKVGLPRLERRASALEVKAYEDTLDGVICAWVAIRALEGRATSFGDENSAIWIPHPLSTGSSKAPRPR